MMRQDKVITHCNLPKAGYFRATSTVTLEYSGESGLVQA
jgi:hypothetical protein